MIVKDGQTDIFSIMKLAILQSDMDKMKVGRLGKATCSDICLKHEQSMKTSPQKISFSPIFTSPTKKKKKTSLKAKRRPTMNFVPAKPPTAVLDSFERLQLFTELPDRFLDLPLAQQSNGRTVNMACFGWYGLVAKDLVYKEKCRRMTDDFRMFFHITLRCPCTRQGYLHFGDRHAMRHVLKATTRSATKGGRLSFIN